MYHAARRTGMVCPVLKPSAINVTREHNPNSTGVVCAIAKVLHCLCVSTPICARASSKVTAWRQRRTNPVRICRGVGSTCVDKENLWIVCPLWVAHQDPAHQDRSTVIVNETPLLAHPHDTQTRRHRAFARGAYRADQQNCGVFPHGLREQRSKLSHQGQQRGRQC